MGNKLSRHKGNPGVSKQSGTQETSCGFQRNRGNPPCVRNYAGTDETPIGLRLGSHKGNHPWVSKQADTEETLMDTKLVKQSGNHPWVLGIKLGGTVETLIGIGNPPLVSIQAGTQETPVSIRHIKRYQIIQAQRKPTMGIKLSRHKGKHWGIKLCSHRGKPHMYQNRRSQRQPHMTIKLCRHRGNPSWVSNQKDFHRHYLFFLES